MLSDTHLQHSDTQRVVKRPISRSKTAHFRLHYGPNRTAKRPVLETHHVITVNQGLQ